MKITIYTVSDCQFSKAEKEYLASHNLPFEEKNLEQNREWLTEMLAVSNNFAGTPVTKIEKDDGQIIVLKGFTKEEFDKTLNLTPQEITSPQTANQTPPTPPQITPEPPQQPPPSEPNQQPSPPSSTTPSVNQPPPSPSLSNQPPTNPSSTSTQPNDPLNSILNELQTKVNENNPNQPPPPSIPDFPAKE